MKILYDRTHHLVVNLAAALLLLWYFICTCLLNVLSIWSLAIGNFLRSKLIIKEADSAEDRVRSDQGFGMFRVVHDHQGLVMAIASLVWLQFASPVEGSASLHPFCACIGILDAVEAAVLRIDFGQVEGAREQVVDLALKLRND